MQKNVPIRGSENVGAVLETSYYLLTFFSIYFERGLTIMITLAISLSVRVAYVFAYDLGREQLKHRANDKQ